MLPVCQLPSSMMHAGRREEKTLWQKPRQLSFPELWAGRGGRGRVAPRGVQWFSESSSMLQACSSDFKCQNYELYTIHWFPGDECILTEEVIELNSPSAVANWIMTSSVFIYGIMHFGPFMCGLMVSDAIGSDGAARVLCSLAIFCDLWPAGYFWLRFVILFNLVSLGIEVDIAAKVGQNDVPKYFDYMNLVVVIIFIMELAVAWHIGAVDISKLKSSL